ncbi:MAG: DUF1820 family protein [Spirochaetales bacterium]|nr:DUF1820 family protein [Spirochaetales bacterium]
MSLYKVHFKWKEKEIQLNAKQLDLTHPYFVSIKDLVFEDTKKIIINPQDDDIRKDFGSVDHIMIPFQAVTLIEEIIHPNRPGKRTEEKKIMPFTLVEENKNKKK